MSADTETSDKKITVITGGAGGMGLAAARIMGADHHVVICDIEAQKLDAACAELTRLGVQCDAFVCDVTDSASVVELASSVSQLGSVASLIHAAGLSPQMASPELIVKVNALGTININEAFYDIADEGFCVVNVASMAAHLLPGFLIPQRIYKYAQIDKARFLRKMLSVCRLIPGKRRAGMAYSLSKNFVLWYSRQQAGRFGQKGARILSVSPGSIDTEMGRLEEKSGSAAMLDFAALNRFGRADEVAELLVFCASEKASYMTGIDILCDGGVVAGITPKDLLSISI